LSRRLVSTIDSFRKLDRRGGTTKDITSTCNQGGKGEMRAKVRPFFGRTIRLCVPTLQPAVRRRLYYECNAIDPCKRIVTLCVVVLVTASQKWRTAMGTHVTVSPRPAAEGRQDAVCTSVRTANEGGSRFARAWRRNANSNRAFEKESFSCGCGCGCSKK
jgi:hypothetical protein